MLSPCAAPVLQVVTQYGDRDVPHVLEACERMEAHLTAAVVSNDIAFVQRILGSTVNGTTYAGIRARTTGGCALGDAQWAAFEKPWGWVRGAGLLTIQSWLRRRRAAEAQGR